MEPPENSNISRAMKTVQRTRTPASSMVTMPQRSDLAWNYGSQWSRDSVSARRIKSHMPILAPLRVAMLTNPLTRSRPCGLPKNIRRFTLYPNYVSPAYVPQNSNTTGQACLIKHALEREVLQGLRYGATNPSIFVACIRTLLYCMFRFEMPVGHHEMIKDGFDKVESIGQ